MDEPEEHYSKWEMPDTHGPDCMIHMNFTQESEFTGSGYLHRDGSMVHCKWTRRNFWRWGKCSKTGLWWWFALNVLNVIINVQLQQVYSVAYKLYFHEGFKLPKWKNFLDLCICWAFLMWLHHWCVCSVGNSLLQMLNPRQAFFFSPITPSSLF